MIIAGELCAFGACVGDWSAPSVKALPGGCALGRDEAVREAVTDRRAAEPGLLQLVPHPYDARVLGVAVATTPLGRQLRIVLHRIKEAAEGRAGLGGCFYL